MFIHSFVSASYNRPFRWTSFYSQWSKRDVERCNYSPSCDNRTRVIAAWDAGSCESLSVPLQRIVTAVKATVTTSGCRFVRQVTLWVDQQTCIQLSVASRVTCDVCPSLLSDRAPYAGISGARCRQVFAAHVLIIRQSRINAQSFQPDTCGGSIRLDPFASQASMFRRPRTNL